MVVRDDLPFLKRLMKMSASYADEFVIIDNGSKDGTWEFLQEQVELAKVHPEDGPKIVIEQAGPEIIPELGFSYLKNRAAQLATCDWIHSLDADEVLDPKQQNLLKPFLKYCKADVLSIITRTFEKSKPKSMARGYGALDMATEERYHADWPWWIAEDYQYEDMSHRRIYRRNANLEWRGYIHEELYQGETNAAAICQNSEFRHWHFTNFRWWQTDDRLKRARYSWMLLNAYRHPGLQVHTNRWWYGVYVPQHLKDIEHWAGLYEEMKKEGKV